MQIYTSEVHLTPSEKDVQKGSLECNNALLPRVSISSSILKTEWRLLRKLKMTYVIYVSQQSHGEGYMSEVYIAKMPMD